MPDLKSKIESLMKEVAEDESFHDYWPSLARRMQSILELMAELASRKPPPQQLAFVGDCEDCDGHGWNYDNDGSGDTHTCTTCKGQEAGPTELGRSILELLEWREKQKESQ